MTEAEKVLAEIARSVDAAWLLARQMEQNGEPRELIDGIYAFELGQTRGRVARYFESINNQIIEVRRETPTRGFFTNLYGKRLKRLFVKIGGNISRR